MRLVDLSPEWIHPNIFIFKCPHCQKVWLSCKNKEMKVSEQFDIFIYKWGIGFKPDIVPCDPKSCWSISETEFNNMTVIPSLDASKSGHWHGNISNGNC